MAETFKLPDLGEGIAEAEILKVLVKEGDEIEEDQALCEVETDKAVVEIPSPFAGKIKSVNFAEGDIVKVGDVMIEFSSANGSKGSKKSDGNSNKDEAKSKKRSSSKNDEDKEEEKSAKKSSEKGKDSEGLKPTSKKPKEEEEEEEDVDLDLENSDKEEKSTERKSGSSEKKAEKKSSDTAVIPAAPSTRRLAREKDIDLEDIEPSGPGGRVLREDIEKASNGDQSKEKRKSDEATSETKSSRDGQSASKPDAKAKKKKSDDAEEQKSDDEASAKKPFGEVEEVPFRSIRRKTARKMVTAWEQIPHVAHFDEVDITNLEDFLAELKEELSEEKDIKLTITSFMVKAAAVALRDFPSFNAELDEKEEKILLKRYYNVGFATDTGDGLLVPVIKNVESKGLSDIAKDLTRLSDKARDGKIEKDDLAGGSFTITNIGSIGGTGFVPIINHPQTAILGLARAQSKPANVEGEIKLRRILPLILAFDHRVADGAEAAHLMNAFKQIIEDPRKLLL